MHAREASILISKGAKALTDEAVDEVAAAVGNARELQAGKKR